MNVRERKPRQKKEIVGEFLAELLTGIINSHFNTSTESTFPNVVKSLNNTSCKGSTDKHVSTNYRPVSVLNTFLKTLDSSVFD